MDDPFPNPARGAPNPAGGSSVQMSSIIKQAGTGPGLNTLFGPSVQGKQNQRIPTLSIKASVIGIYFSAHWCPPCREFTPILSRVYQDATRRGKSFEIIFCSSDRDASRFEVYWNQMPWPSLPFENRRQAALLGQMFGVRGIPCLVLVNNTGARIPVENTVHLIRSNAELFISQLPDGHGESSQVFIPESRNYTLDGVLDEIEGAERKGVFTMDMKLTAFKTISAILNNALANPQDPKYRSLKKENRALQSKLMSVRTSCFVNLLKVAGFRETVECYVLPDWIPSDSLQLRDIKETIEGLTMSVEDLQQNQPTYITQEAAQAPQQPPPESGANASDAAADGAEPPSDYICDGDTCRRKDQ